MLNSTVEIPAAQKAEKARNVVYYLFDKIFNDVLQQVNSENMQSEDYLIISTAIGGIKTTMINYFYKNIDNYLVINNTSKYLGIIIDEIIEENI